MLLDRPSQRRYKLLPCHVLHIFQLLFVVTHLEIQKQIPLSTIPAMYIINKKNTEPSLQITFSNNMIFSKVKLHSTYTYWKICCCCGTPVLKSSQIISPSGFLLFIIATYQLYKMEKKIREVMRIQMKKGWL